MSRPDAARISWCGLPARPPLTGIAVQDVCRRFDTGTGLQSVTFSCEPNTLTVVAGGQTSGKSALLRIMAGALRPQHGTVLYDGRGLRGFDMPGRHVGFSLGPGCLHPHRTVADTLRLVAMLCGHPARRADDMAEWADLTGVAGRHLSSLSSSTNQRVSLAAALIGRPSMLVVDAPVRTNDADTLRWIHRIVRRFVDAGGAAVMSTRSVRDVLVPINRVVGLAQGRVAVVRRFEPGPG